MEVVFVSVCCEDLSTENPECLVLEFGFRFIVISIFYSSRVFMSSS